ncbi:MAG: MoxR family ATPase [Candidatus Hydrogenedentes bacterium]|nr:MoxR family ATPase [Candidatus Hydrogenedentota bacterium]
MSSEAKSERLDKIGRLRTNITQVIRGKDDVVDMLLIALLSGGSVLLEDAPGVGKTTLAKALAASVAATFNRVQFTPDLLPADILGSSIYNPVQGTFAFRQGPVFCNILLADEINRSSPRTQSALLEAMSEGQATIEGERHVLDPPFLVLATQNSVEFHGTYPLPEAQLDRFMMQLSLGYPEPDIEAEILHAQAVGHPLETISAVASKQEVLDMQHQVRAVRVDKSISNYIVELATATRRDPRLKLGVSTRGSLMMFRSSQAAAYLAGRDYVLPDDVQRLAPYVLAHRLVLTSEAKYGGTAKRDIVREIVERAKVPA